MSHDQLFKQVLEAFFADFLRLFDPATAARLDLTTITFRDTEVFTDIPRGERRTADVVAEVRTLEGEPELVIVHVEIQRERESHFSRRMWEYYISLRQRENLPVIPIALVFYAAREGIGRDIYEEAVFDETIVTFRYLQISLPLLQAEKYVQTKSVLGAGLASVMRLPSERSAQIQLHRAGLRRVLNAERVGEVDPARAFLLGNLIETYLPLSDEEREELRVQLESEGGSPMELAELTWADRRIIEVKRKDIRRVMELKFGQVSPALEAAIKGADSEEELDRLFDRAVIARTEADVIQPST